MFPGPGAVVYRNEAGEPTGWDYPDYDAPEDENDYYGDYYEEDADPATCEHDGWTGEGKNAVCSWCDTAAIGEYQDGAYADGTPFIMPIWPGTKADPLAHHNID